MAKIQAVKLGEEYLLRLSKLSTNSDQIIKKALYEGAAVVADAIKDGVESLPTEPYRRLRAGERFSGISQTQKDGLVKGFGLAHMEQDATGWNTKAGFAGYIEGTESKKYPNGLPVPLLARAIESGSSVRQKHPFVRTAVNAKRNEAVETMEKIVDTEIKKIMK